MSLKLYLTSSPIAGYPFGARCDVWVNEPELTVHETWGGRAYFLFAGVHPKDKLAALGFPPPGKMRVIEVGEYEEEK